jgi:hypothetical protein
VICGDPDIITTVIRQLAIAIGDPGTGIPDNLMTLT